MFINGSYSLSIIDTGSLLLIYLHRTLFSSNVDRPKSKIFLSETKNINSFQNFTEAKKGIEKTF